MKRIYILLLLLGGLVAAQAQETDDEGNLPVRNPFNSSFLIDQQTHVTPAKGSFEFIIHHRFGEITNIRDLYGIYAPSNIRLGINYGITDQVMVGFGTEKNNKMQEFLVKWAILRQSRSGSMPVSLSYYASMNIDARDNEAFGQEYKYSHRMSYFHQLMMGRKFGSKLAIQGSASFAHFNAVDSVLHNDRVGLSIGGRYNAFRNVNLIAEYDFPVALKTVRYFQERIKPNLAFGVEFGTSTHAFQVFAANYRHIIAAKNLVYNTYDFTKGDFVYGFNITVRF